MNTVRAFEIRTISLNEIVECRYERVTSAFLAVTVTLIALTGCAKRRAI
jgi:hypothetical protein